MSIASPAAEKSRSSIAASQRSQARVTFGIAVRFDLGKDLVHRRKIAITPEIDQSAFHLQ